jgi:8-oxo-dGTP diphosphatase
MIIPVVAAVLRDAHGQLLLAQRPEGKHLAGLWEFPGGKLEPDEEPAQGLKREIAEELGIDLHGSKPLLTLTHHYEDRTVRLMLREADAWDGSPSALEGQQLKGVTIGQAGSLPMPAADRPIVKVMGLDPSLTVIPDPSAFASEDRFLASLTSVLNAGARLVIVTLQSLSGRQALDLARRCAELVQGFGVRWLLDSTPEIVSSIGADGLCVSARRLEAFGARPLPHASLVAVRCSSSNDLAVAGRVGADFAVLEVANSTNIGSGVLDWARHSALISNSPLPVFVASHRTRPELVDARISGAYGTCLQAPVR